MERRYRVTVRGRLGKLDPAQRAALLAEQAQHDVFTSEFTPEGSFLYEPQLINFQYRYSLTVADESPEDAEALAQAQAEESAQLDLRERGLSGEIRTTSVVSVDDMKVRKTTWP